MLLETIPNSLYNEVPNTSTVLSCVHKQDSTVLAILLMALLQIYRKFEHIK